MAKDIHSKTTYVLKNGEHSLEFASRTILLNYRKRFTTLFPEVDDSSLKMFKVVVYEINS